MYSRIHRVVLGLVLALSASVALADIRIGAQRVGDEWGRAIGVHCQNLAQAARRGQPVAPTTLPPPPQAEDDPPRTVILSAISLEDCRQGGYLPPADQEAP